MWFSKLMNVLNNTDWLTVSVFDTAWQLLLLVSELWYELFTLVHRKFAIHWYHDK